MGCLSPACRLLPPPGPHLLSCLVCWGVVSAPLPILANDVHRGACSLAVKDAESAGVVDDIRWSNKDILDYT